MTRPGAQNVAAILFWNLMKVALIGAGSTVFAKTLIGDLLSFPELADGTKVQ